MTAVTATAPTIPVETKPLATLGTTLDARRRDAAKKAAEDFEAVFITQMMQPMFEGLKTDGLFGGGNGEAVFRSLMIQEVGKEIAKGGGVGIADGVYREMLRMQGLSDPHAKSPPAAAYRSSGL